jgi:tricorn protease
MIGKRRMAILVYDIKKQKDNVITNPILQDFNPCFSLDGKYLYFISARELDPVGDKIQFEASFPRTDKIYVIPLRKDVQVPTAFGAIPDEKERQQKKGGAQEDMSRIDEKEEKVKVQIDFKNIKDRVALMPLPISIYEQIAVSKDRIFALAFPIEGALSEDFFSSEKKPSAKIIAYDLKKKKVEIFFAGASYFYLTKDKIFIRIGSEIRVFPNSVPITPEVLSKEGKEGGNIDITRAKILVEPLDEWRQMYKEAWRLQRDNFWNEKMSDIDWNLIFKRYFKLIDKIGSRGEFSDLVWEMQGELGTSHCYEFGGDYHKPPVYKVGFLGGEFKWDNQNKGYKITNIISGDTWNNKFNSPLQTPGANISEGEIIREIDGIKVKKNVSIERMLLNKAKTCIELSIYDPKAKKERAVFIDTIGSEINLRYRNWVEKNREYVHKKTNGKIGYVHIPDMGPYGFSEFHRYFLSEIEYDGLVVDIRYNGGGNVSQLILEKLARKRIGYDIQRWGQPEPYPTDSVMGQIIVLTNEHAGSDGDIFSHCSKLLKLGKLIGKRTWGGVIGIWPRHFLSDGAVTTQPEFSFWFKDVGWGVENYGTDPDIEVDNRPKDYKSGKDRQLDVTIEEIMKEYKENPPKMPKFDKRPSRKLPKIR